MNPGIVSSVHTHETPLCRSRAWRRKKKSLIKQIEFNFRQDLCEDFVNVSSSLSHRYCWLFSGRAAPLFETLNMSENNKTWRITVRKIEREREREEKNLMKSPPNSSRCSLCLSFSIVWVVIIRLKLFLNWWNTSLEHTQWNARL